MKLFGQIIRTAVNVATLPVAVARDVVTLAGAIDNDGKPHTLQHIEKIKDESDERGRNA